jgi:hypothetical protein
VRCENATVGDAIRAWYIGNISHGTIPFFNEVEVEDRMICGREIRASQVARGCIHDSSVRGHHLLRTGIKAHALIFFVRFILEDILTRRHGRPTARPKKCKNNHPPG